MSDDTKEAFRVPQHVREQQSLEAMGLWIAAMAEIKIQRDLNKHNMELENRMFKQRQKGQMDLKKQKQNRPITEFTNGPKQWDRGKKNSNQNKEASP